MNQNFSASISNTCYANEKYYLNNPMSGSDFVIPAKTCIKSIFIYTNNPITDGCGFCLGIDSMIDKYIPQFDDIDTTMINNGAVNKMIDMDIALGVDHQIVIIFDRDFTEGEICFVFNCISA
jgi:hypothetical protein